MTFAEYASRVRHPSAPPKGLRRGQYAYNLLSDVRRDVVLDFEALQSREIDPYNNDGLIPSFLEWVEAHW